MSDRGQAWEAAVHVDRHRRGFDHERCWLPHFTVPARAPGERSRGLSRAPVEEDIRGTLAAIAELAGWCVSTMPCDPDIADDRECITAIAQELENLARGLRCALETHEKERTS